MRLILAIVTFAVLFATGYWLNSNRLGQTGERYLPTYRAESGTELLMVYISSASCGACNDPELPELVEKIKLALSARAASEHVGFAVVGVGIDWSPDASLEHLAVFGSFDELIAGRNWLNSAALKFFWHER